MNTWQKVFEYMDGYTEQVDLVKIKLRQKQALGLLAGAIADELTGLEGSQNTVKTYQTVRTLAELNSLDYNLLVYDTFFDQEEEREAETLNVAWSKFVQAVKKYFAF